MTPSRCSRCGEPTLKSRIEREDGSLQEVEMTATKQPFFILEHADSGVVKRGYTWAWHYPFCKARPGKLGISAEDVPEEAHDNDHDRAESIDEAETDYDPEIIKEDQ